MHRIKKPILLILSFLLMGVWLLAATDYQMHTVKRGDSLYKLAKQYGVTVNEIKQLNNMSGINLDVGQKLKIKPIKETIQPKKTPVPSTSTVTLEASGDWQIYEIKRGDNLYNIGKQFGVTVEELKKINNLSSNALSVGQKLKIKALTEQPVPVQQPATTPVPVVQPEKPKPVAATSTPTNTATPETPAVIPSNLPDEYFHMVQPKENLYRIAVNAGLKLPDLLRYNSFADEHVIIVPGQRLLIKDPKAFQTTSGQAVDVTPGQPPTDQVLTQQTEPDSVLVEKVYVVQRKDTLFKIAKENNMTVEELKRLNNLKSNAINVGQKLYIIAPRGKVFPTTVTEVFTEEDLKTKAKIRTDLIMPVDGKILSEYGIRNGRPHKGIDLGAPAGTPVFAVLDGTVVYSGIQGSYGNVVVIEHPDFVMTVYAHNEKNMVKVGDAVKQGQIISTTGSTGNATTSHVHFEYRIKGKAINPRKVLPLG